MYAHYDEEQRMLADAVDRMARDRPQDRPAAWADLVELGLPALGLSEAQGGSGAGGSGFHAVLETLGRHRVTTPFLNSAICCTQLLLRCATPEQQARLLPAVADGTLVMALASSEPQTDDRPSAVTTTAHPEAGGWRLDGRKTLVVDGGDATAWLVTARTDEDQLGVFMLSASTPGLVVRRYRCIDGTAGCDLTLQAARVAHGDMLGAAGPAIEAALERAIDATIAGQCAESVGLQAALFDMTVAYVKDRRQFGATLGSFQVVQHRLADMLVSLEQARSLAWHAASMVDDDDAVARRLAVSAAKVRCVESGRFIGLQAIHLHGGMGMTDELPVGHYVKRLLAIEHTLGDARHHLARFATLSQTTVPKPSSAS